MIVHRMRNGLPAAGATAPALAAVALVTGLATGTPASAATQPHSFLASVSCTGSSACIAVGGRAGRKQRDQILALGWNGARWRPQVPVDVNHTQPNDLNNVTCASPAECFAVGSVGNFNFADHRRLIERWNGTRLVDTGHRQPQGHAEYVPEQRFLRWAVAVLLGISCAGPASCIAVGRSFSAVNSLTLALRLSAGTGRSRRRPARAEQAQVTARAGAAGAQADRPR